MENIRLQRGQEIANKPNQINRIDENTYKVKSKSSNNEYDVICTEKCWICSCPDYTHRNISCKHILSVEISFELRKTVASEIIIPQINVSRCPQCQSQLILKDGLRHNKYGDIQRYTCKNCFKRFTINLGFERMHATPQVITSAMQLYFTGGSFRNVQKFLKLQGVNVSHMGVYKWINMYVKLMEKYLDKIKPNVSNVWRTDELYLKVKGNTKYLYAMMDDQTRFIIVQQVADSKNTTDITRMISKAKEITGTRPNVLISDGGPNFHDAFNREFRTIRNPGTRHINYVRLQGDHNNNKTERF